MADDLPRIQSTIMESQGPGLVEYLGVFQRRPRLIFVPMLVLMVVAGFAAMVVPEQYESTTRLKVRDAALQADLVGLTQVIPAHKPGLNTIDIDILNRSFLRPIIDEIGLTEGYNLRDPDELNDLFEYIAMKLKIKLTAANVGDDIIEISYRGRDPDKVMEFVNSVRKHYMDDFVKDFRDSVHTAYEQTRMRRTDMESSLATFTTQREAYKLREDVQQVLGVRNRDRQLLDWETMRQQLRIDIDSLEGQEEAIKYQIQELAPVASVDSLVPNPRIAQTKLAIEAVTTLLYNLTEVKKYTDKVEAVRKARAQLQMLKDELEQLPPMVAASRVLQPNTVRTDLETQKLRIALNLKGKQDALLQLNKDIFDLQRRMDFLPEVLANIEKLDDDIKLAQRRLIDITRVYDRIETTWENMRGAGSDLFQTTEFPRSDMPPVFPSLPIFMGIGAGAGLLLGIGLAFLKEFSGMTFTAASQVQSLLPVPILGEVGSIVTASERKAASRESLRRWLILIVIVAVVAAVHVAYFNKDLSQNLPAIVVKFMNQIYQGG